MDLARLKNNNHEKFISSCQRMKTKTELDQGILDIITTINKEFPELSKYIDEMHLKIIGKAGVK